MTLLSDPDRRERRRGARSAFLREGCPQSLPGSVWHLLTTNVLCNRKKELTDAAGKRCSRYGVVYGCTFKKGRRNLCMLQVPSPQESPEVLADRNPTDCGEFNRASITSNRPKKLPSVILDSHTIPCPVHNFSTAKQDVQKRVRLRSSHPIAISALTTCQSHRRRKVQSQILGSACHPHQSP